MEPRDISATTDCILQDIDYGLMSFTMEDLEEKKQEMFAKGQGVRTGKAVFHEGQLTPDEPTVWGTGCAQFLTGIFRLRSGCFVA